MVIAAPRRRMTILPPGPRLRPGTALVLGAAGAVVVLTAVGLVAGPAAAVALMVVVLAGWRVARMPSGPVSALVVIVYVLLLMPARLRISPLGIAGTPAALVGVAAFTIWSYGVVFGRPWLVHRPQPLRWAMLAVACSVLASYLGMGFRVHDYLEGKAADRGLLTLVSMVGVCLLAADSIRSRAALRRVLEAVVTGGVVVAGLGMVQFFTGVDIGSKIRVPGFTYVSSDYSAARSGFNRIVSTTSHPIELSVTLVLLLPLALHLAATAPPGRSRRWWLAAGLIGAAAPMTVSRTAVVALFVCALVLFPAWPPRLRLRIGVAALLGLVLLRVAIPGLLGTLRSFLLNPGQDPSLQSRQIGANYVSPFISERPWFGRGFQTFLPTRYEFLDNQVLLSLVETGVLGLLALLSVFGVAAMLTRLVRAGSDRFDDRDLAQALLACLFVGYCTWFTYDALGFPTGRTLLFLVAGLAGAQWRILREDEEAARAGQVRCAVPTASPAVRAAVPLPLVYSRTHLHLPSPRGRIGR